MPNSRERSRVSGKAGGLGEAAGFGRDLSINLSHYFVAVLRVIGFREPPCQGQLPVALVNPKGELPRFKPADQHAPCERSHSGFLASLAGDRIDSEAELIECCRQQVVHVLQVISFGESAIADEGVGDAGEGQEVAGFAFVASVEASAAA